jgi:hypothetical protein
LIWWLMAAGLTFSSLAALRKLAWRAAASKAFSALSGGKRSAIGAPLGSLELFNRPVT